MQISEKETKKRNSKGAFRQIESKVGTFNFTVWDRLQETVWKEKPFWAIVFRQLSAFHSKQAKVEHEPLSFCDNCLCPTWRKTEKCSSKWGSFHPTMAAMADKIHGCICLTIILPARSPKGWQNSKCYAFHVRIIIWKWHSQTHGAELTISNWQKLNRWPWIICRSFYASSVNVCVYRCVWMYPEHAAFAHNINQLEERDVIFWSALHYI